MISGGSDYTVVKKTSGECVTSRSCPQVPRGQSKTQTLNTGPPPRSLIRENNDEKILDLTNKLIELLTGEGEDVTNIKVEVLNGDDESRSSGHECDLEEIPEDIISSDGPSDCCVPEQCMSSFSAQDWQERRYCSTPQHSQGEDLKAIKVELVPEEDCDSSYYKLEEIPIDVSQDDFTGDKEKSLLSPDCGSKDNSFIEVKCEEYPSMSPVHHSRAPSQNYKKPAPYPSHTVSESTDGDGGNIFLSSECRDHEKSLSLSEHWRISKNEWPFPCLECGRSFKRKDHLKRHQRLHQNERPYSCSECGKGYNHISVLVEHRRIHTGERPFLCNECGKCFVYKSAFFTHQKIHSGEKPFFCLYCGKCFTRKSVLIDHEKIHTGEKPFLCQECGRRFTQRSVYVKHQRIHTGEKPFSCSVCGKCFARKSCLHLHEKIHTGVKPFSCSECGKSFIHKRALVRHEKIHTKQKPFLC
ncbi:uncharacterized protein ACNLHF_018605 isoform 2-T2 [Anomaloglossus baeobatrachus]